MLPVSVVVPYYKGLRHLPRLLRTIQSSGASQTVIVVDGGGEEREVRAAFSSVPGAQVVVTFPARGTAGARNHGASLANQPLVTFLDQDDSWPDGFLHSLVSLMGDREALAYDSDRAAEAGDGDVALLGSTVLETRRWAAVRVGPPDSALLLNGFPMVKLLLRTDLFRATGGFRTTVYAIEDFDLVWRLVARGCTIDITREPRGIYLEHAASTTAAARSDLRAYARGQRSWVIVWTGMAGTRSFPLATRVGAGRRAVRAVLLLSLANLRLMARDGGGGRGSQAAAAVIRVAERSGAVGRRRG